MDATLKALFESGKTLLADTKQRRKPAPGKGKKGPATKDLSGPPETDPFKIFVRKCVDEKRKKVDIVEDIQRFIKTAEEAL
jgi:hypothetical protein